MGVTLSNTELKPKTDWKLKIDCHKSKIAEMNEILRIYGNVSGNSTSLKDENHHDIINFNDHVDEKAKKTKDKQEIQIIRKKRYKPLEETKKDKIHINYNDDADVKFDVMKR